MRWFYINILVILIWSNITQADKPTDVVNVTNEYSTGLSIALALGFFFVVVGCSAALCAQCWDWYRERDNIYNTDNDVPVVYQV